METRRELCFSDRQNRPRCPLRKKSLFQVKLILAKQSVYPIVYSYEGKEETANVTVKADQSKLEVKDTTIYVGDKWEAEDNFVSATDKTGQDIPFEKN